MNDRTYTLEEASELMSHAFIYKMPFNQLLGIKLMSLNDDFVQLTVENRQQLIGNFTQNILHGGVIASVFDVAGGMVCINRILQRINPLTHTEIVDKMSRMGTIDLRVDYLRPGRGQLFTASASLLRDGNKIAVTRCELHNENNQHIATATATYLVG
ncbi:TPA: thioesterase family protein [Providencia rettgeri]|nr:thioesterase family protein [Providencia rettgeri]